MARHWSAVINCADIDRMTDFWCAALDLERHPRSTGNDFRVLRGRHGNVALQAADTPVTSRDQVHFDLYTTERDAEVARLLALGATYVRDSAEPEVDPYIVLADPEGNYLCVCPVDATPAE